MGGSGVAMEENPSSLNRELGDLASTPKVQIVTHRFEHGPWVQIATHSFEHNRMRPNHEFGHLNNCVVISLAECVLKRSVTMRRNPALAHTRRCGIVTLAEESRSWCDHALARKREI